MQRFTCAFLQAAGSFAVHSQLTVEVLLPEFSKPNISSVVGQRAAAEIPVKRCKERTHRSKSLEIAIKLFSTHRSCLKVRRGYFSMSMPVLKKM